ncbi:unnamed protein product [Brassicogethes aeneus]|uniref:Sulfatase N-terminal domain-containing protein n=1 Tax=Brassicogethes aeneus TaxID=1431903 RepID=A0A9P0F8E0_BRAAE|nr:unnamed protein product [Brassicogethes aeneus]
MLPFQQALCAPSRNSFLTSRRPDSLKLYDFYSYWRDVAGNFTTFPQHFKENGYYTKSVGKIFHPGASSNYTDDFPLSWSKIPFHPKSEKYKNAALCPNKDGTLGKNLICPVWVDNQPSQTLPDMESLKEAVSFISDYKKNDPYFLAVGFHKPHVPFRFPIEYLKYHPLEKIELPQNRWRPSLLPTVAWNPWNDLRRRDDMKLLNISYPFGPMPDKTTKKIIQSYNTATTYIDDLIGKLIKHVDKNTITVITADHGWSMGEHGEFSKFSNFQTATKVPLIINIPNLLQNTIYIDNFVELVDIFPSLVDITGVSKALELCPFGTKMELCTEGRSFVRLLKDKPIKKKTLSKTAIFTQYPRPSTYPQKKPDSDRATVKDIKIMGYSIKTPKFRYSEWIKFNQNFTVDWNTIYGKELYDITIDPEENMNLIGRPELSNIEKTLQVKLRLGWRYV